jgi:hypothetical protein
MLLKNFVKAINSFLLNNTIVVTLVIDEQFFKNSSKYLKMF